MVPDFHVLIPARHASSRLPGKPLKEIAGKPMIVHVVEAARASGAVSVTVATDHVDIEKAVKDIGANAILTSPDHVSGSDRIAEACTIRGYSDDTVIVNVQGDEPEMSPALIRQVAELLITYEDSSMATLCAPVSCAAEFLDPSAVKVVLGKNDEAIYFSRAPLPWIRSGQKATLSTEAWKSAHRHLGIYAYRAGYLQEFTRRGPCSLEREERLEQLRALWYRDIIVCRRACVSPPPGVDTAEDLEAARFRMGHDPGNG